MLNRIHRCLTFRASLLNPSRSLIFTEPSVSAVEVDRADPPPPPSALLYGAVYGVLSVLTTSGSVNLLADLHFRPRISGLSSEQVDQVVDFLAVHDPSAAVEFFDLLRNEFRFQHSSVSHFVIAHVLAGRRWLGSLRDLLLELLQREGSGSGPSLCDMLLNSFKDCDSNVVVWDMLAFSYSRSEMVHDALFVAAKMKDLGFQPSIMTYNSLLHNLRHLDVIRDVYSQIKTSGGSLNEYTSSIFIDGLCRQSLTQEALAFLREESTPSVVSFTSIMSGFCRMGYIDAVEAIFCMMFKYGLLPDSYSYNVLIHGLCVAGSIEEALDYTIDMDKHGVEPTVITYTILANAFCRAGNLAKARQLVDIIKSNGLVPDAITYTTLMNAFSEEGNLRAMFDVLREMQANAVEPNHVTYTVVIKGLCKQMRLQESLRWLYDMFSKGLLPNEISYNTLILGFCKARNLKKAFQLHNEMLTRNINPNHATYNILINGLCVYGHLNDADRFLSFLREQNVELTKFAYIILIKAHFAKGNVNRALVLFRQLVEMKFEISVRDYSAVINRLCKRHLTNDAKFFLCLMLSNGIALDQQICSVMIDAFIQVGDLNSVLDLLPNIIKCGLHPG